MSEWSLLWAGLAGAVVGGVIAWMAARARSAEARALLGERERERSALLTEVERVRNELVHAQQAASTYLAERDAERRLTRSLGEHTAQTDARARDAFAALGPTRWWPTAARCSSRCRTACCAWTNSFSR